MKIVKVDKRFLAAWRENESHLVDSEGHVVGRIDRPLASHLATVVRSARSQRKTVKQRVAVGPPKSPTEHVIEVTVTRIGQNMDDLSVTPTIDGHRVVTGREVLAAEMFQAHGECQLRWPNNVILKVIRDPNVHRPTFAESQQIAPKPEHCSCRSWGRPHPGTHYPTCQWNRLAPPEERAPSDLIPEEEVRVLPKEALEALKPRPPASPATTAIAAKVDPKAVVVDPPPLDAPDSCRNGCLSWATPSGFPIPKGQHHPTCVFAREWAIKTARETPRWLVDLRSGERVRIASNEEVGEAEVAAQRLGQPIITLNEVPYAVILETELDAMGEELGDEDGIVAEDLAAAPASSLSTGTGP
jgi:hypothetical protein